MIKEGVIMKVIKEIAIVELRDRAEVETIEIEVMNLLRSYYTTKQY